MAQAKLKAKPKKDEESASLKGTMASVAFLGIFIIVTWLSVYFLFVNRF
ncbi:cytochrome c oxidase subunit 2A [Neobacillus sp. PS3-34]|nr:cytochrome c oxidase subunit 2A [Neobacillus sp. PS3-34]WML47751.1 cytochrome c oxidase subunit 2A [Neobacillus sp. PS3-34]